MRISTLALCGLSSAACLRINPSYDSAGGESSGGATGAPTTAGSTPTSAGTTGADPTATDASTGAVVSTGATAAAPDLGGSDYPHYPVSSCAELQAHLTMSGETPASGYYSLDIGGPVDVYCDMVIAGGGWTLVGRSAGDAQLTSFGWLSARGDVAADDQPYSLDLGAHPIDFTEILLGDYAGGKTWGGHAYLFVVGPGYVQANLDGMEDIGQPTAVLGGCDPVSYWMFRYGGLTSVDQAFFFRDLDFIDGAYFGLLANGFYLHTYVGCEQAGELNHKHGMLMVR